MDLSTLKPANGATKNRKRIGRGQGSGRGGTSTRGHKGAKSRSGYSRKIGFEGGQMPLYRRLPKFGFKSFNRVEYIVEKNGIISSKDKVKILGRGELNSTINVTAHAFSKTAKEAIESKGGVATTI